MSTLDDLASQYGLQLPTAGQAQASTKQEPQVFMGTTPGRLPAGTGVFDQFDTTPDDLKSQPGLSYKTVVGPDGEKMHIPMGAPAYDQGTPPTSKVLGLDAAANSPLMWKRKTQLSAMQRAASLGYSVDTFADFLKVWSAATKAAATAYNNGQGKKISPWDMMAMLATNPGGKTGSGSSTPAPFTGTKTTTSVNRTIDDIDPATADAALTQTLSQLLGRDPTTAEKADYLSRATALSKLNPTIAKTTTATEYQNGSPVSQTSNTENSGGLTSAQLQSSAEDMAKSNPEYGAYQAAGTVYNWLQAALGAAA